jgi:hypothetical protein
MSDPSRKARLTTIAARVAPSEQFSELPIAKDAVRDLFRQLLSQGGHEIPDTSKKAEVSRNSCIPRGGCAC